MMSRRVIWTGSRCIDCRVKLMDAFLTAHEPSFRPLAMSFAKPTLFYRPSRRGLSQPARLRSAESTSFTAPGDTVKLEEPNDDGPDEVLDRGEPTPWYLQVDTPDQETTNSLLQKQSLPQLPPDPPPLLQPMLEHIFVDLGIDDLLLFDLRKVDPPPALGANLIMVIGTARSEKHLHVSADRFRRWMKTTHQIFPHADGLLGHGELKLKLKRKARRARILGRVGSSESADTDDGIRTGWICVTVSNIEDGVPVEEAKLPDGYVGFGGDEQGANVVIQLLTREKREELDLEELWGKIVRQHEQPEGPTSQGLKDPNPQDEVGHVQLYNSGQTADIWPKASTSSPIRPAIVRSEKTSSPKSALQGRGFSTQNRNYFKAPTIAEHPSNGHSFQPDRDVESSIADNFIATLPDLYEERLQDGSQTDADTSNLKAHLDFARGLSIEDTRIILGTGAPDTTSTPFLRSFHAALPLFPTAEQWRARLSLITLGMIVGAPGYNKTDLIQRFQAMQSALITIPASLYRETIITLLTPGLAEGQQPRLTTASVYAAADFLEDMVFRGHEFSPSSGQDNQIRELFELAIIQAEPDPSTPPLHPKAFERLRASLSQISSDQPPTSFETRKLIACAATGQFQAMWDIWQHFAAEMRSRPTELYIAMLMAFEMTGHQAKNAEMLRVLVPEMEVEEPPVKMNREVAEAVKACIRVVDPSVEKDLVRFYGGEEGTRSTEGFGEWHRMWRTCERVIEEEGRWAREMDDD